LARPRSSHVFPVPAVRGCHIVPSFRFAPSLFETRFLLYRSASLNMVFSSAALQPTRSLSQRTKGRVWMRLTFKESRLRIASLRLPFQPNTCLVTLAFHFEFAQFQQESKSGHLHRVTVTFKTLGRLSSPRSCPLSSFLLLLGPVGVNRHTGRHRSRQFLVLVADKFQSLGHDMGRRAIKKLSVPCKAHL